MCEQVHIHSKGYCLQRKTGEELLTAVTYLENNDFFKENFAVYKRAAKFEEEHALGTEESTLGYINNQSTGDEDLVYWVSYAFEFGGNVEHLQPQNLRNLGFIENYELDTHVCLYLVLFCVTRLVLNISLFLLKKLLS